MDLDRVVGNVVLIAIALLFAVFVCALMWACMIVASREDRREERRERKKDEDDDDDDMIVP